MQAAQLGCNRDSIRDWSIPPRHIQIRLVGKTKSSVKQTLVGEAGLEPATPGLEGRCSIQLSYSPTVFVG